MEWLTAIIKARKMQRSIKNLFCRVIYIAAKFIDLKSIAVALHKKLLMILSEKKLIEVSEIMIIEA